MEEKNSSFQGMIVLNSNNYSDWKIKMEDLLIVKDLYEPIDRKEIPTGVIESDWKILHRKAASTMRQFVDVSILQHVANDTNSYELWHKLAGMYERKNALNKASLMRKLVRLKYSDGESIVVHTSTFMGLVNQLASAKMSLDDELHALLLLSSLPDSWETLVVSLSNSCQEDKLSLEAVKASLLNEETRRKEMGASSQSEVNVTQDFSRGRSKQRGDRKSTRLNSSHRSLSRMPSSA